MRFKLVVSNKITGVQLQEFGPWPVHPDAEMYKANLIFSQGYVTGLYMAGAVPIVVPGFDPEGLKKDLEARRIEDLGFEVVTVPDEDPVVVSVDAGFGGVGSVVE